MRGFLRKKEWEGLNRFGSFQSKVDSLFKDFLRDIDGADFYASDFKIKVDVEETADKFFIKAEVPGMAKEEIDLSFKDGVLSIKGEKKETREEKNEDRKYHIKECRYGSFERSFMLPDYVDVENIKASFKDGVLEITIPKKEGKENKQKITIE